MSGWEGIMIGCVDYDNVFNFVIFDIKGGLCYKVFYVMSDDIDWIGIEFIDEFN